MATDKEIDAAIKDAIAKGYAIREGENIRLTDLGKRRLAAQNKPA